MVTPHGDASRETLSGLEQCLKEEVESEWQLAASCALAGRWSEVVMHKAAAHAYSAALSRVRDVRAHEDSKRRLRIVCSICGVDRESPDFIHREDGCFRRIAP